MVDRCASPEGSSVKELSHYGSGGITLQTYAVETPELEIPLIDDQAFGEVSEIVTDDLQVLVV
jgi:hypothetical protein